MEGTHHGARDPALIQVNFPGGVYFNSGKQK
jgi:hypothetical protein